MLASSIRPAAKSLMHLVSRGFAASNWHGKGDLSELAMHQPPICIADPENDPGMPGMEHPILGSFDTPTDIAVDDAVDEDEGGCSLVEGEATYPPEMLSAMQAELERGERGWGLGDEPSPQLRAAAKALGESLAEKGRRQGYRDHTHQLAGVRVVKVEPHPAEAELKEPAEPQEGELPMEEMTLPGEAVRQAMAVDLPLLRRAEKRRPLQDRARGGHDTTGPAVGYSGGD